MFKQLNRIRPLFDRQDKIKYLGLMGLMIIGACLDVIGIGAVPAFVAALAMPDKIREIPIAADILDSLGIATSQDMVIWGGLALIFVFIFKNLYLFGVYALQVRVTEYHRVRLATRLFKAYVYAPWEFHLQKNSSELLRNVYAETKEIMTGVLNPLLNIIMGFMMTLLTVILLLVTTPGVAVIGITFVGGASWLFLYSFKKRLQVYGIEAKKERKEMIQAVTQGISALQDIRVGRKERFFVKRLHVSVKNFARVSRLRQVIRKASPNMLEMVAVTGLLGIVLVLVLMGNEPASLVPMLALYGAAIVRLRQSVSQIVGSISQLQFSAAAIPAVVDDLQLLETLNSALPERVKEIEALPFKDQITVSNLHYTYPETEQPAIKGLNLSIRKGESIGFVGATGSGKSTLINLLLGFFTPQQGSISIDGVNMYENVDRWLMNVGYIPQTIFLLDDTIRRNIAFGIPDEKIDDEKVNLAVETAQLGSFIKELAEGLDTVVGERGVRLSGGQRQRIGLARALYHNPDVLVMDEATSALDNYTESLVMDTINALKKERTIIMIAHRLSTVKECDRLYFLKAGEIDASGSYDELSREHADFRKMADVA